MFLSFTLCSSLRLISICAPRYAGSSSSLFWRSEFIWAMALLYAPLERPVTPWTTEHQGYVLLWSLCRFSCGLTLPWCRSSSICHGGSAGQPQACLSLSPGSLTVPPPAASTSGSLDDVRRCLRILEMQDEQNSDTHHTCWHMLYNKCRHSTNAGHRK